MAGCYIIYSRKIDKFYIGATKNEVEKRMEEHNNKCFGNKKYTAKSNDWQLFLFIESKGYAQALKIEKKLKAMKSRIYLENLKRYPELIDKLLLHTI